MSKKRLNAFPPDAIRANDILPLCRFLARRLKAPRAMLEVGSYVGDSSLEFAKVFDIVHCVDAWAAEHYTRKSKTERLAGLTQAHFDDAHRVFLERTQDVPQIRAIRENSLDVAARWEGEVDFIYIDASHEYRAVMADIKAWLPRASMFIGGHDYHRRFPGVRQAVNELFGGPDLVFPDTSWLVWK